MTTPSSAARVAKNGPRASPMHSYNSSYSEAERVKVFVRVRPLNSNLNEAPGAVEVISDTALMLKRGGEAGGYTPVKQREFIVDKVFDPAATQLDVYEASLKPLVDNVLQGYTAALLAYGQTGAGKTYTMANDAPDAVGLIPRAASHLFAETAANSHCKKNDTDSQTQWTITMSYVQIYMERVQDLLKLEENTNLQLREDPSTGQVLISNVHSVAVTTLEDCLSLLHLGNRNRATGCTNLNEVSSRSHAVVMFDVTRSRSVGTGVNHVQHGKLFLVDLAGSERVKKSGSVGQRAEEARSINLSLTTLGKCVAARAHGEANHVPVRESKLTRLLQGALTGAAKTAIVVNVCGAMQHAEETIQSLLFGSQAMQVTVQARVNARVEYTGLDTGLGQGVFNVSGGQKAVLLEQTLLKREAALKSLESQMNANAEHSRGVIAALEKDREAAAIQEKVAAEKEAQMLAAMERHKQQVQEAAQTVEALRELHQNELQNLETQNRADQTALAAQHADSVKQLRSELLLRDQENRVLNTKLQQLQTELESRAQLLQQQNEEKAALALLLDEERQLVAQLRATAERQQQSHVKLARAVLQQKRRHNAARLIQRHYRLHLSNRRESDLYEAKLALGEMVELHADLEARRAAHLAFSGEILMGDCMKLLQEGAEVLVTTFLMPSKDQKTLSKYSKPKGGIRGGGGVGGTPYNMRNSIPSSYVVGVHCERAPPSKRAGSSISSGMTGPALFVPPRVSESETASQYVPGGRDLIRAFQPHQRSPAS